MPLRLRTTGIFKRLLILCLGTAVFVVVLSVAGLHVYRTDRSTDRVAAELASLARAIGPLTAAYLDAGDKSAAARALKAFAGMHYVICADYVDDGQRRVSWPNLGCEKIAGERTRHSVPVMLPDGTVISINVRIDQSILQQRILAETAIFAFPLLAVVIVIFLVLTVAFRNIILKPLDLLKYAMVESTPRGPVRAQLVRDDEIGALVRVYNKLVAGSRLYIRRLDLSQAKLAASEQRFRDLAEVSGDWFFEMDDQYHLTYISDFFYQLTGLKETDVVGKSRAALAAADTTLPHWQRHQDDLEAHREFKNFEYQIRGRSGELFDVSISGVPLFNDAGDFSGYRGVGSDISEIKEKERQLAEANRNFGDSVTYASSIQRGLLANSDILTSHLGTARIVWQPKDLVGGDFYWVKTIANVQYLVFYDCTGHGVPGAFMTLIVTSVLEKIAVAAPSALPAKHMLQQVHDEVCRSLGIERDSPGTDGLDCAIVRLDRTEDRLEFVGASIDLFVIDPEGKVTRHRGARTTLGYEVRDTPLDATPVSLHIGANSFVMTTDGLLTQIGEATGRVLGTRRFEAALGEAEGNAPTKLIRVIARLLKNWQGREERRDDVSFVAFKPNDL